MTFEQFRWLAQWPVALCLSVLSPACLTGCQGKDETIEAYEQRLNATAETAAKFGLEFEVSGTFGDGHCMGQAFNFSGLHGSFRMSGKPTRDVVNP